ncbi:AMP-dependent synthetase/ligase [Lignipirellula cremea]|uniref:Long-chain-fatty-acid--CoA ligase FadD15 n=1 Tax=Lignipirellula cremea TaxID=2528010 RepID=A0A518DMJ5_9BACT|nr:AMP-dependent synthetase/ligase [Lignipirellula cremea]QDU93053.1 Long-chain-fatty-acid--CoA ligase FadD15 [Lignipirellula cremea]
MSSTVPALLQEARAAGGDRVALRFHRGDQVDSFTWIELVQQVERWAAALAAAGVKQGDCVVHLSENRWEWIVADLALHAVQAVHVPLHSTLTGPQLVEQINHCHAAFGFVSRPDQARKLADCSDKLVVDIQFFSYEPCEAAIGRRAVKLLPAVLENSDIRDGAALLQRAAEGGAPSALATILYTSGTTGEPKGVMLTQENLVSNAQASITLFDDQPTDVRLSFLPLSHIFARTCDLYTWLISRCELCLARARETVIADCHTFQPHMFNGVPHFFDRVVRGMRDAGLQSAPDALRNLLGGRIRFCVSGGAALPDYLFEYFEERGVPILQGYGLTEAAPVIAATGTTRWKKGSVGPAIPGVEIQISDDGEVLARGPNIMTGYFRNPTATAEAIRDGWLHTGDLGKLDEEGWLWLTGRKKEILVTSGGKNIAPVMLEGLLTADPIISQALVVGDDRRCLAALLVLDRDRTQRALGELGQAEAVLDRTSEAVRALVRERIDQALKDVSAHEQVRHFALLEHPFSIESGELTPKLTLRRKVIEQTYAAEITALYADQ